MLTILSNGSGTRLWPIISSEHFPKQRLQIITDEPLRHNAESRSDYEMMKGRIAELSLLILGELSWAPENTDFKG